LAHTGQAFRKSAEKYRGREGEFSLTKLVESGAEKRQSGFHIAALDEKRSL
jgi:hypothetical protein